MYCKKLKSNGCVSSFSLELDTTPEIIKNNKKINSLVSPYSYNARQIGQDKKSLISTFAYFLTAIVKAQFLERLLETRLCLCTLIRNICTYFLISQDSNS